MADMNSTEAGIVKLPNPAERALGGIPSSLPTDRAIARMEHDANLFPAVWEVGAAVSTLDSLSTASEPSSVRKALLALTTAVGVAAACAPGIPPSTDTPRPIVTDSPFPSPTLPKPTETIYVTPSPTASPTENPTPTESPTPTPTFSFEPTPVPTPTPEIPKTKDFVKIVESIAEFDAGGELESTNHDLKINYSRDALDNAGIASISITTKVMQDGHDAMLKYIYKAIKKPVGSAIDLQFKNGQLITLAINKMVNYTVTRDQYSAIIEALDSNQLKYGTAETGIIYKGTDGTLYHVNSTGSNGLSVPDGWDRTEASARIIFDGPMSAALSTQYAALRAKFGDQFSVQGSDIVYNAYGVYALNDKGKVDTTFN